MNNPFINTYGDKFWYNDKKELHRENGPAIEYSNGTKEWCLNGKRHREDGPAIEYSDGNKYWYLDGRMIDCHTQKEFEQIKKLLVFYNE